MISKPIPTGAQVTGAMLLIDFFEQVYKPMRMADSTPGGHKQYRVNIGLMAKFLGRVPTLADFTEENLGAWMRSDLERGLSPFTCNSRRRMLLTLWRFAKRKRFPVPPEQDLEFVDRFKTPRRNPIAWTHDEMRRLIEAARLESGRFFGVAAGKWWTALLLTLFDTGLRRAAAFAIRFEEIDFALITLKRWHGGPVYVDDLTDNFVNGYLAHEKGRGMKPETLRGRRRNVLMLWRDAFNRELIATLPMRVCQIKAPPIIPSAWTAEEVAKLIATCDSFYPCHVHRTAKVYPGLVWKALIMLVWDTGLRRVDWERLKRSDIAADGVIHLVQHKTAWPIRCVVRPETLAAIDATLPTNRKFIWGIGHSGRARAFRHLVKKAGLTGSLKKLRKSSATAVEILQPGSAMAHLGHKTPGLAAKHYVDPRQVQAIKTQPPSLGSKPAAPKEQTPKEPAGDILAWI